MGKYGLFIINTVWCCKRKRLRINKLCISGKHCGIGTYILRVQVQNCSLWRVVRRKKIQTSYSARKIRWYVHFVQCTRKASFFKSDLLRMLNTSLCWWRRADTAICIYGQSADTVVPTNQGGLNTISLQFAARTIFLTPCGWKGESNKIPQISLRCTVKNV